MPIINAPLTFSYHDCYKGTVGLLYKHVLCKHTYDTSIKSLGPIALFSV